MEAQKPQHEIPKAAFLQEPDLSSCFDMAVKRKGKQQREHDKAKKVMQALYALTDVDSDGIVLAAQGCCGVGARGRLGIGRRINKR